jgi:outer membrane protein OmpA-like peptidoglycan-associated protein
MNDPSAALQRIGAALSSGDRDAVVACFAADATLEVMSNQERMAFTSTGIREAIDTLMAGFDDIKLTPTSRLMSESRVVQESVLSGDHTGSFAGAQPTSGRVRINVKLSATAATDLTLLSLWVEPDTRALFAQIAGTGDVVGVTGGLIATARERHDGAVRVIGAANPPVADDDAGARRGILGSGRRWAALAAAAVLLLMVFLAWRPVSTGSALIAGTGDPTSTETSTSSATPAPRQPAPAPRTPPALPAISTAAPKSVPHVQSGRQVVLNSDVLFGFDSAALTPAARGALTRVAGQLRSAGVTGTIQVNGYTDNLGGVAYDLALSRARALAVARVLQTGLAGRPVTLAPQGFGQANPVAPNTSDPSRARNRRVTIVLPTLR